MKPDLSTRICVALVSITALASPAQCADPSAEDAAFFQKMVEPVLVQRCYECHSHAKKIKGGLALDSRSAWQSGGDSGPIITPGDPEKSLLIRAVDYTEPDYEMPPKGKLPEAEIAILRDWVKRGAPDPRGGNVVAAKKGIDIEEGKKFWAFQPIAHPALPKVGHAAWPISGSDYFILATLEKSGLAPAPDADLARFFRRLTYDLTGLPQSWEATQAFLKEAQSDVQGAIESAVDRMLASDAFGEKWGRHWLDLARYADSNGSSFNPPFPQAWRYRNWVIAAHNKDLPFPQFVAMQLAGDLLPYGTLQERDDNVIATGYLMLGSKVLGEFDKEQLTMDVVDEQVDTVGKSLLGLTLGCARCHDHKFDPVPQRDYYALAGIFTSTVTLQDRLGGPKEDESDWSRRGLRGSDEKLDTFLAQHRYTWVKSGVKKYDAGNRIAELEGKLQKASDHTDSATVQKWKADLLKARTDFDTHSAKLAHLETMLPPYAEAVRESTEPADTALRIRGVPSAKADTVPRGFLQVASWPGQPQVNPAQSGRLELAQWIGSPHNPLTARVQVNRIWKHLFGEGLVRSVDNFGPRGDAPTHPELLDHLAQRFIAGGWRLKPIIREIVVSRAYRMSTRYAKSAAMLDPENRLLWRQNKRRLEPEEIRDTLLACGGQLNPTPAQNLIAHFPLKDLQGSDAPHIDVRDLRRTIYQPIIRTMESDILQIFDFAPTAMTTGQRPQTTVPPQSLFFMNAPLVQESAKAMARRIEHHMEAGDVRRVVEAAYSEAIGRMPTETETRLLVGYLETQFEGPPGPTIHDLAKLCQAILGSTQFQFLD